MSSPWTARRRCGNTSVKKLSRYEGASCRWTVAILEVFPIRVALVVSTRLLVCWEDMRGGHVGRTCGINQGLMLALGNVDSPIDTGRAPVTRRAQQMKGRQRRE